MEPAVKNIHEYRCLFIVRELQVYRMEPAVENILECRCLFIVCELQDVYNGTCCGKYSIY